MHENTHLNPVKQHGVPCPFHGHQACRGSSCSQHDLTVGVEQRQSHKGEVHPVKHTVLVVDRSVAKQKRVVTKNRRVEETWRFIDYGDEQVGDGWSGS